MILIGDIIEKINDRNKKHIRDTIEVLYKEEEKKYVENRLNIKIINNNKNRLLYIKNKKNFYILYNVDHNKMFKKVYNSFVNTNKTITASNSLNYAYYKGKIKCRNTNVNDWLRDLSILGTYNNLLSKDEIESTRVNSLVNYMFYYNILKHTTIPKKFDYNNLIKLDKEDIVKIRHIIAVENKHPKYNQIILKTNVEKILVSKLRLITKKDKIHCCIEKIRYDTCIDIIDRLYNNYELNDIYDYYKTSIMNIISNYSIPDEFKEVIINNLSIILKGYNSELFNTIIQLYKNDCFTIKK